MTKFGKKFDGRIPAAKDLDQSGKDRLIVEFAPLVKFIAQRIAMRLPANIELDDLISAGIIGLMDSIEKYDPSRDNKFKTYAEFRIRGAILDELRSQDWVPRSVRERCKLIERTVAKLECSLGRPPSEDEISRELGMTLDEYQTTLDNVKNVNLLSIDDLQSVVKGDKRSLLNSLDLANHKSPFVEYNLTVIKTTIADGIRELPEKQRLVLSLYYYEDLNLKEIGKVLDVTESRVSQLHTQAIIRLKAKLRRVLDDAELSSVN